ncbi:permease-like cell division protein FtsX [Streptosporangium sp. NPDC023615]|uniref:permease-like cell division protein FtsX n=1 Tax=Streptosporangium sp. NPDC023615 TaxID=3154794 RepID=UPI00343FDA9E
MESDKMPSEPRARGSRAGIRRIVLAVVATVTAVTLSEAADAANEDPGRAQASPPAGSWTGEQKLSPPPDGPWPQGAEFTLFLCRSDDPFDICRKRAITAKQRRALRARLEAMPQVKGVRFESRTQAWANFKERNDDEALISAMEPSDMPESFRGMLRRRADVASFRTVAKKTPGVSNVFVWGARFWKGKADVSVTLCGGEKPYDGPCAKRGPVTRQEKAAIEGRLSGMRQVQRIYVEDAAHAKRVFEYFWMNGKFRTSMFSESYHIRLTRPGDARMVMKAVKDMPGVQEAHAVNTD